MRRHQLIVAVAFAAAAVAPLAVAADPTAHEQQTYENAHGDYNVAKGVSHGPEHELHINWFSFDYGPGKAHEHPPLGFAIINFAILIGLLVKFGGPKIRQSLVARHDTIKNALEEGARLRKEAQAKLAEYEARIGKVDAEVEQLVSEIRAQAEEEKKRILAEAEKQAAAMKKDAADRISAEIERARRLLEAEVVAAAVTTTETILTEHTRADDQDRLVDTFISSLGTTAARGTRKGAVDDSW